MATSENAFPAYVSAAEEAERLGANFLTRVYFTSGMRRTALADLRGPLNVVESASSKPCSPTFSPRDPFEAAPYQAGWRLIGRCLVWKIQDAVALEQWDEAVRVAAIAMKFGLDLTGGSASDASLGFALVNEARGALSPSLEHMDPEALGHLSRRVATVLESHKGLSTMIDHEHQQMLHAVQYVQTVYRSRDFDSLRKKLGSDVRNAVDYLEAMVEEDGEKRPAYFEGFAAEVEEQVRWLHEVERQPHSKRKAVGEPKLAAERPWWRFSKHFLQAANPLLTVRDRTLARTRLLAIEAEALHQIKAKGRAPANLAGLERSVTVDPFTGMLFVYRANGSMYSVYSVGEDLRDDGGETDEGFQVPDLRLEK